MKSEVPQWRYMDKEVTSAYTCQAMIMPELGRNLMLLAASDRFEPVLVSELVFYR